jgi:PHD/YefM family antitoxin component YafN of YafNO toxin-antitoxin module
MKTYTATTVRKKLFHVFGDISRKQQMCRIKYKEASIVMMHEDDYEELLETIMLLSHPSFKAKFKRAEPEIKQGETHTLEDVCKRPGASSSQNRLKRTLKSFPRGYGKS